MRCQIVFLASLMLILASCVPPNLQNAYSEMRRCSQDADCMCGGTLISSGECFLGNKQWAEGRVNFNGNCPDFCGGEGGDLVTKCVAGVCKQVSRFEQLSCVTDTDCTCGGQIIASGDCFVGNKMWAQGKVDFTKDCPDFCTGIAGNLETHCVKNQCKIVRTEQQQSPQQPPSKPQCTTNADCVAGGCSSHLCMPKSKGPVFSTCEWTEAYACVKSSTCGCVDGRCAWAKTPAYVSCMKSAGAQP